MLKTVAKGDYFVTNLNILFKTSKVNLEIKYSYEKLHKDTKKV